MKPKSKEEVRATLDKLPVAERIEKGHFFGTYSNDDIKELLKGLPIIDRIMGYYDWGIYSNTEIDEMTKDLTPREKFLLSIYWDSDHIRKDALKDMIPFSDVKIGDYLQHKLFC